MTIQDHRSENSRRRTPPIKQGRVVSEADFDILKQIHLKLANGDTFELYSPDEISCYYNAKALHDRFGFTVDEVFEATGFLISEKSEG